MSLLDWIYPPRCISCRTIFTPLHNAPHRWICDNCKPLLITIASPFCLRCGHPKTSNTSNPYACLSCQSRQFHFESHRAAFVYDGVVRDMIHHIKFQNDRQAAQGLGQVLAEAAHEWGFNTSYADYIVPIPLHPSKKRTRGFNQAAILAKPLSKTLGISMAGDMIKRTKKTAPQSGLSVTGREQNLSDAFAYNKRKYDISNKKILLIDDIFTSGATMSTCAKLLMANGAVKVTCLSLSIAVRDFETQAYDD